MIQNDGPHLDVAPDRKSDPNRHLYSALIKSHELCVF
jgi:hypothetical protein